MDANLIPQQRAGVAGPLRHKLFRMRFVRWTRNGILQLLLELLLECDRVDRPRVVSSLVDPMNCLFRALTPLASLWIDGRSLSRTNGSTGRRMPLCGVGSLSDCTGRRCNRLHRRQCIGFRLFRRGRGFAKRRCFSTSAALRNRGFRDRGCLGHRPTFHNGRCTGRSGCRRGRLYWHASEFHTVSRLQRLNRRGLPPPARLSIRAFQPFPVARPRPPRSGRTHARPGSQQPGWIEPPASRQVSVTSGFRAAAVCPGSRAAFAGPRSRAPVCAALPAGARVVGRVQGANAAPVPAVGSGSTSPWLSLCSVRKRRAPQESLFFGPRPPDFVAAFDGGLSAGLGGSSSSAFA